ncbi:metalloprotease ATP23 [Halteromyces radiatus]|uniref:metalloprotease ATP23 n=1 Tax=Halteromyces radiatus TaxID=101107 RepID=UPI0022208C16|nr:metalloprotease ATP23 [Halteromyces radiatus]KAI8093548.1 metalloprotease ATP23 [Halteromyces radiatus]
MTDVSNTTPINDDTSKKDMKKFERWRKSLQYLTGLGMNETERKAFRDQIDIELAEYQCQQCERWKTNLIKNNPPVRFMMDELKKIGREMSSEDFQCMPCDETRSGGFSPEDGILLCQNRLGTKTRQEHTMVHEMVHMYDHHKFKVNWSNLRHHACSEIRAASLSGDCNWSSEIQRGFYTFTKQHQACVKRRAILSVAQNPNCKDKAEAERAVSSVFESCFADTRPFDEIY